MIIRQLFVACFFLAALCSVQSQAQIPVIENPQQAPDERTIRMEEVWRIGNDDGEDFVLGVIKSVISDETGNFYLLDSQQSEVFKFSPDGQYLKSVSRKGEGPGELSRCHFFEFWDKSTVACFSKFPHKFIRFDLEGIPAETLAPTPGEDQENDGRMAMSEFMRRDGFLVARGTFHLMENGGITQKSFLSGFDDQARETICYGKFQTGYDFTKPVTVNEDADFNPLLRWTLGREGEVYTAPHRTDYLLEVKDPQGKLLRKITRTGKRRGRTDDEKEAAKNRYSFGVAGREMPQITYKISDYPQAIDSLSWIDDQLWVRTSEGIRKGLADGTFKFDIFDKEGHLVEERSYLLPMDMENDEVHWLDGGRVVVVKNYKSAKAASRGNNVAVQRGDGKDKASFDDSGILEVIYYRTMN